MDEYIKSILKDFFEEAFDLLGILEKNVLILEKNHNNKESIQEIFRAIHTLKSSSGTVELTEIEKYSHNFEDVLDLVRSGNIEINNETINMLLKAIDIVRERVLAASEERKYKGSLKKQIKELDTFRDTFEIKASPKAKTPKKNSKEKKDTKKSKYDGVKIKTSEIESIKEALAKNSNIYTVLVKFDGKSPMRTVGSIQIYASLKDFGTVLSTNPSLEELQSDTFYEDISYVVLTEFSKEAIETELKFPGVTKSIKIDDFNIDEYMMSEEYVEDENVSEEEDTTVKQDRQTVYLRVENDRVDYMMNQVGELVINKSSYQRYEDEFIAFSKSLEDHIGDIKKHYKDTVMQILRRFEDNITKKESKEIRNFYIDGFNDKLKDISVSGERFKTSLSKFRVSYLLLTRVTNELQDTVMKIRMVPISQILNRFPRLIRDLSIDLGKEVDLVIFGEETELDKSVIDLLLDPIIHLVRNAIGHGIETPEERVKMGKSSVGTITISASHEGNMIVIKIIDDGAGMNSEDIYNSALSKGVISAGAKLTEKEIFELVFTAGFSTSETVSNVSGRGVGMDVVLNNLEKINGTIGIETVFGKGSTFSLKIPLTLAIIEALIVESEKEFYAIPISSIVETIKVEKSDIIVLEGIEVINIKDEVVNIARIKDLFKLPSRYNDVSSFYAVVLMAENKKIALLVNNLIGEQDIVIKALKDQLTKVEGIAGATILGDGTVSFILDTQTIVGLGTKQMTEKENYINLSEAVYSSNIKNFVDKLKKNNLSDIE